MSIVSAISKGRFGNFCFVNFAAYAYSVRHGLDFHIQDRQIDPQWPLYFQEHKNINWNPDIPSHYVNDYKHSYTNLEYNESWKYLGHNIIVGSSDINTGYFQSYKYLRGYEDEIREKFKLPVSYIPNTIGVHVRRGDFLLYPDKHPVITEDYIDDALTVFIRNVNNDTEIRFFSDDINWCKQYAAKRFTKDDNIEFSEGNCPEDDFKGLMCMEHLIVSNSSFSVLAAILNPNPNKIVVCPDKFFGEGNKHLDTSTLYPHGWVRLNY